MHEISHNKMWKEDSSEDIRKDNNQLLIVYKMRIEVEEDWKIIALYSSRVFEFLKHYIYSFKNLYIYINLYTYI